MSFLDPDPNSRLANVSTRALVRTGDEVAIAGMAIAGTEPKRVLVRAVGPGLARFNITGPLAAKQTEPRGGYTIGPVS